MKIVSLEVKEVGIGKFFPKEGKAELCIKFNDGADKEILKGVDFSKSESVAENILADLRKMEKSIHKNGNAEGYIVENFVNIVVKNEDEAIKEIAGFIQKVQAKIEEIKSKNVADGYLDIIRQLKSLKLEMPSN